MSMYDNVQEEIENIKLVIANAEKTLRNAQLQEEVDLAPYTNAQQELESCYMQLEQMIHNSTPELRDQLQRVQQMVQKTQNEMVLGFHVTELD
jgi:hypothetical protein